MRSGPLPGASALAALVLFAAAGGALADSRLLMFRADWCDWCARWEEEIGVAYAKTEEGRRAPLERVSIHADPPGDVALSRPPRVTPTFVLLRDGREVGRIEGYAGAHFFYPMLNDLLDRLPGDAAGGETEGGTRDETD